MKRSSLGNVQAFGPVTLSPRPSGRWAITWSIEWEFAELGDALDQLGKIIGIVRSAATWRVRVSITPERTRQSRTATAHQEAEP